MLLSRCVVANAIDLEDLSAEELGDYPLDGTKETIPQFCDVLALFEDTGLPIIVELKSFRDNYAALAERTMHELDKFRVVYCRCTSSSTPKPCATARENALSEFSGIPTFLS